MDMLQLLIFANLILAASGDWVVGVSSVDWKTGTPCGGSSVCFHIDQMGHGIVGVTPDCYRQQLQITRIENFDADYKTWTLISSSGFWQYGVKSVVYGDYIDVTTFVIQDHGGPKNICLSPGEGHFYIGFSK
jgi:hypothetical protein